MTPIYWASVMSVLWLALKLIGPGKAVSLKSRVGLDHLWKALGPSCDCLEDFFVEEGFAMGVISDSF